MLQQGRGAELWQEGLEPVCCKLFHDRLLSQRWPETLQHRKIQVLQNGLGWVYLSDRIVLTLRQIKTKREGQHKEKLETIQKLGLFHSRETQNKNFAQASDKRYSTNEINTLGMGCPQSVHLMSFFKQREAFYENNVAEKIPKFESLKDLYLGLADWV